MKPEESIEILELPKEPLKSGTHYHAIPSPKRISYTDYLNARKAAVEALEKQVPKKPQLESYGYSGGELVYDEWFCPKCGEGYEIDSDDYNYCPECGQKIDWRNEE